MKRIVGFLIASVLCLQADVNLITDKSDFHINWLVDEFKQETGIKTNVLFTEKGLVERAKVEKDAVLLTNDALNLVKLSNDNVIKDIDTKTDLYHTKNYIVTSGRVRGFFVEKGYKTLRPTFATETIKPTTYDDIISEKYNATICIRPLTHNYNLVMFSYMLETKGEAYTRNFIDKLRTNLATAPDGNDRSQVKLISEGICNVSIGNSYYMGLMQKDPVQAQWASKVEFVTPKDPIWLYSAVAMTNDTADNRKFIEFLTSKKIQDKINANDFEFTNIKSIGDVKLETVAKQKEKALKIVMEN